MYKEDWSRLIAGLLKIIVISFFGLLAIKLMMGFSRVMSSGGSDFLGASVVAFTYVIPFFLCVLVIAVLVAPGLAERLSGSLFNFLYPQPRKVSRIYSAANVFLIKGKYAEAVEEYRRVIEEDPEDTTAQLKLAEVYDHRIKDFASAILEYEKLLAMKEVEDNLWVSVRNRLTDIYSQHLGNGEEARRQLEQIIEKFPGARYSHQALQRISKLRAIEKSSSIPSPSILSLKGRGKGEGS